MEATFAHQFLTFATVQDVSFKPMTSRGVRDLSVMEVVEATPFGKMENIPIVGGLYDPRLG